MSKKIPHAERNWKRIADFDAADRTVIAERLQFQSAGELADVFLTTPQTINAIAKARAALTLAEAEAMLGSVRRAA